MTSKTKGILKVVLLPCLPKTIAFFGMLSSFLKSSSIFGRSTICGTNGYFPSRKFFDNHSEINAFLLP